MLPADLPPPPEVSTRIPSPLWSLISPGKSPLRSLATEAPPGATHGAARLRLRPAGQAATEGPRYWLWKLRFPTVFHIHITFNTLLGSNNTEPAKYFHAPSQPSLNHSLHGPSPGEEMAFSARGLVGFLLSSPEIYLQTLGRRSWWSLLGGSTQVWKRSSPGLQGRERGWFLG